MDNNLRSLFYVILFASLSAVSALGMIDFSHTAYADNNNMSDNMSMNATMNASENMTGSMNGNMTASTNETMTGNTNETMTGNTNETMTGNMTGNTNNVPPIMQKILSPLEQFKSGTSAKMVQCEQGFSLVIKIEDGSPACVTSQIAQALVARGWGTTS